VQDGYSIAELVYQLGRTRKDVLDDAEPPSTLGQLSAGGRTAGSSAEDQLPPIASLARWSEVHEARRRAVAKAMRAAGRGDDEILLELELLRLQADGLTPEQILEQIGPDRMAAHSPQVDVDHRYLLLRANGVTEREAAEAAGLDRMTARRHFRATIDAIADELGGVPEPLEDRVSRAPACMKCGQRPRARLDEMKRKQRGKPPKVIKPERPSSLCMECLTEEEAGRKRISKRLSQGVPDLSHHKDAEADDGDAPTAAPAHEL